MPPTPVNVPATGGVTPPSSNDPAEQIAPAGVPVEPGALPITTIEAIAMRQELENLIGRFESALLSADAATSQVSLQVSSNPSDISHNDGTLVAAVSSAGLQASQPIDAQATSVLMQAQQILETFPDLVAQGDYAAARQQWLEARQLLWDNFPTDRPLAQPEIRAMWLDRGTIVNARSRQGLARLFDQLSAAGINTVFFETVNAGYPIYPSQIAPQQNPLTRGWDPLADAVELAHERGMELHAWVWTFAAGNTRHNSLVNMPDNYLGPLLSAHPDWANYDNRGNPIPPGQTKPFLDPANPTVRSYLLRLFQEIVTRYDVDGLQLDYIRYPFQDPSAGRSYGYGLAARQRFQQLTGVDPTTISPSDRHLWEQWTTFRTEQVNTFVAETSRVLRRLNPNLILSVAVFPLSEHERIQKIQQDWETWAQRGDVDLIVTMSYAADTNRLERLVNPWIANADLGPVLVLPSIRLLNLPTAATVDQLQAIRDMPAGGYSLFAVADLNETLQSIFNRTQGTLTGPHSDEPIPYRQPFQAAVARYNTLRREWSFMFSQSQLWIREDQFAEWSSQSEALAEALEQLAEQPSDQHLRHAKTVLRDFCDRFEGWMALQSLNDSYRIRIWENHLETLEVLLNYGEHFTLGRQIPTAQASH